MDESAAELFRRVRLHIIRAQRADIESRVAESPPKRERSVEAYVAELDGLLAALLTLEYSGILDEIADYLGAREGYRN